MYKKIAAALIIAASAAASAHAGTVALTWSGSGSEGSSSRTRGWAFSSSTAIDITSLGWFDFQDDGLATSHQVGIWDFSGKLLLQGTVAAGTSDPLLSGFRFTDALGGTTRLAAGNYVVAGLSTSDDSSWRAVDPAFVTMGAHVSYIGDRTNSLEEFGYAGDYQGLDVGYFGANFQYELVSAVPEPASLALSLLGLGLLGTHLRTRRRARQA